MRLFANILVLWWLFSNQITSRKLNTLPFVLSLCMERLCPHFTDSQCKLLVGLSDYSNSLPFDRNRNRKNGISQNRDNSIIFHLLDTYPIYLDFRKNAFVSLDLRIAIQSWMRIKALSQYKYNFQKRWSAICSLRIKLELLKYKTTEIKSLVPWSWRMEPSKNQQLLWREIMKGPTTLYKNLSLLTKKDGIFQQLWQIQCCMPLYQRPWFTDP